MIQTEISIILCGLLFILLLSAFQHPLCVQKLVWNGVLLFEAALTLVLQNKICLKRTEHFRSQDSGLWCCCLLAYIASVTVAEGRWLLQSSVLLTGLCYSCYDVWRWSVTGMLLLSSVFVSFSYWEIQSDPAGILWFLVCSVIYIYLLHRLPTWFPKSFTFGEAALMLQLYIYMLHMVLKSAFISHDECSLEKVTVVIFVGLHLAVSAMVMLSRKELSSLFLWSVLMFTGLVYILSAVFVLMSWSELENLLQKLIVPNLKILGLWIIWVTVSLATVCCYGNSANAETVEIHSTTTTVLKSTVSSTYHSVKGTKNVNEEGDKYKEINDCTKSIKLTDKCSEIVDFSRKKCTESEKTVEEYKEISDLRRKNREKSDNKILMDTRDAKRQHTGWGSSVVRKYFHVAIIGVYIPGLIACPDLLYVASILVAAILVILEAIRVMRIQPLGETLDQYLGVFLDDQDKGTLILTPFYLLVGCSAPLWWGYRKQKPPCSVSMYSGLISVGVGDGVASVFGRKYGRHKWPGSKKSLEGTVASVIFQLLAIQGLHYMNVSGAIVSMETIMCVILISLLEAFTSQIDNLVVSMFAWTLFTAVDTKTVTCL